MIYPKIPLAQSIVQICRAKGLRHVVISPGSRNAPLTIGFVNNPEFICYSIADERCAAFFAMGIAQQTGKPAVVVCTSGSALLNFYPAVAEAFYSQIPLVVISADRPPNMIDIGDGQTIRQENVLHNHSLYDANLTIDDSHFNDFEINAAINISYTCRGPVHINAPFEEPLYETTKKLSVDATISAFAKVYKTISVDDIIAFTNIWNSASRKLILVGVNEPDEIDPEIIELLANDNSVVVMTETTSNLHHPEFIRHIDRVITPFGTREFLAFQPEIVITFGGMVVSKRVKGFLRKYKPEHHWHIDPLRAYDTFGVLSKHFEAKPNDFFQQFLPFTKKALSEYSKQFHHVSTLREEKHARFAEKAKYSDFTVFRNIIAKLPNDIQLHLSNSASIRYAQLFDIDPSIEVFCNRGTSGIDGSTSTAIGAAVGSGKPTILITGDVSFLYDSNALWNNYTPENFKIIVVNNGGGGIFRILPGHVDNRVFNTFFETSHNHTAEHLARMYNFRYFSADNEATLDKGLSDFHAESQPSILEIFTPTKVNDKVLENYFSALA
jgi:2-succinyl-5-enolpyruvyl-6-hydroxy-3-cyclohexene-1-carboxylate synthase